MNEVKYTDGIHETGRKTFLHETDNTDDTVLWTVKTHESGYIDVDIEFSGSGNRFGIWEFIVDEGEYDDMLAKLDTMRNAIEEVGREIVLAKIALGKLADDR